MKMASRTCKAAVSQPSVLPRMQHGQPQAGAPVPLVSCSDVTVTRSSLNHGQQHPHPMTLLCEESVAMLSVY